MKRHLTRFVPRTLMFVNDDADPDAEGGAGSSGDESDSGSDDAEGDDDAEDEGVDKLGDAGKQALDRMKAKLKTERDRRIAAEERANKSAGDDDATKAQREAETAALAKANGRIVRSEIKAAAKGVLADPADAFKFLDLGQFEVDEDGDVDEDEIAAAIADLVKSKPYLAAQSGRRFQGSPDGGTRKESRPAQLNRDDLKRMSPQQITKAKKDGQLADLLGGKK